METTLEKQRLFEEVVALRRRNEQLMAENASLRQDLLRANQRLARMKLALRRSL